LKMGFSVLRYPVYEDSRPTSHIVSHMYIWNHGLGLSNKDVTGKERE
jgi:hypothetical protein